ncbi:endo alpha-1,4 polygalactosaminidase [Solihabitans fulvus]|uniref:endo alpha-1,4 polygalactosaminidase n=1 Tax=Solihabitans fulvus TaxID=1892852 RepID=UPI001CB75E26|nr:endo alpha-1,4 polygalactosaminidase [Solihabitans fulvus]
MTLACALLLAACSSGHDEAGPTPTSSAASSTEDSATGSGSAAPSSPPPSSATPSSAASTPPKAGTTAVPPPPAAGARWIPAPGTPWQWQLTTPVDQSVDVPVYDVDGVEVSAADVQSLHAKGRKVICYVNVGASEDFRPDKNAFTPEVQGKSDRWPGEKWLDVRKLDQLRPIMAGRFDQCRGKGFDAIEADQVDGYKSDTGFPLTDRDQLAYNRMLAGLAHERGLSIGLKNDLDQVTDLLGDFEFAINEQCAQYQECDRLSPFIQAGKAVFHVEYELSNDRFCAASKALRFSSMRKNLKLDAPRWPC